MLAHIAVPKVFNSLKTDSQILNLTPKSRKNGKIRIFEHD